MKINLPETEDVIEVDKTPQKKPRTSTKMKRYKMPERKKTPKVPKLTRRARQYRRAENSRFTGSALTLFGRYVLFALLSGLTLFVLTPFVPYGMILYLPMQWFFVNAFLIEVIGWYVHNAVISGNRFEFFGRPGGLFITQLKIAIVGLVVAFLATMFMMIPIVSILIYAIFIVWVMAEMARWIISNTIMVR